MINEILNAMLCTPGYEDGMVVNFTDLRIALNNPSDFDSLVLKAADTGLLTLHRNVGGPVYDLFNTNIIENGNRYCGIALRM
jgi:hypothetical protein